MTLADDILNGVFDSDIAVIANAVETRREQLRIAKVSALKPGDDVRFIGNVSPKYLKHALATVLSVDSNKKVTVQLKHEIGRFNRNPVKCPVSILEAVT